MNIRNKTKRDSMPTIRKILLLATSLLFTSSMLHADITIKPGWQLLGATQDLDPTIFDVPCVDYAWKYDSNTPDWQVHMANGGTSTYTPIPSFTKGEGYWVLGNDDCTITVPSSGLVADAGVDQTVTLATTTTLDASASTVTGTGTPTYTWALISKPSGSSATLSNTAISNPTFITDIVGSYVFGLMVSDGVVTSSDTTTLVTGGRYIRDDATNIVTDLSTNLEWQDDVNTTRQWVSDEKYADRDYDNTIGYTADFYCMFLTLDGGGWRVPSDPELRNLIETGNGSPTINTIFENTVSAAYWSSTTYASGSYLAQAIDFDRGIGVTVPKNVSLNVRCVR